MDRILIVDDDQAIAYLIADALEDEGFETVSYTHLTLPTILLV